MSVTDLVGVPRVKILMGEESWWVYVAHSVILLGVLFFVVAVVLGISNWASREASPCEGQRG